jgi:hypothetical protein
MLDQQSAHEKNQPHVAGLSKLNSVSRLESRRRGRRCSRRVGVYLDGPKAIDSREAQAERPFNRADAYRSKSSGIP